MDFAVNWKVSWKRGACGDDFGAAAADGEIFLRAICT
jgi:hypothetical protein